MAGAPDRGFPYRPEGQFQAYQPSSTSSQQDHQFEDRNVSPIDAPTPQFGPADAASIPQPPPFRNGNPQPYGMHPSSSYNQMQNQRQYGPTSPQNGQQATYSASNITPGVDNLGTAAAGGGISGIAMGVASANERESGTQALRDISNWGNNGSGIAGPRGLPVDRSQADSPFEYDQPMPPQPVQQYQSYSTVPLAASALSPASANGRSGSGHTSERSFPVDGPPGAHRTYPYQDNPYNSPYNRYSSSNLDLATGINPNEIADDDDWGMTVPATHKRKSLNPFHSSSREGTPSTTSGAAMGAGVGLAAGSAAALPVRDGSGQYNAVPGGDNGSAERIAAAEKSEWLSKQTSRNNRLKWIVGTIIAIVVVAAIVGGVLGGVLGRKNESKSGKGDKPADAASVSKDNKDDLGNDSKEIQALLNNKDLHKVFPGMDYTPLNVQYPECIDAPPSQNNVTRDMAVLSQLTNAVRLYGTDCNQTQMVLHAIDRLALKDMKVWLGVWVGNNDTTNTRQLKQLYDILDDHHEDKFKGVIVGNEVLFHRDVTEAELLTHLKDVKSNLTSRNINLPVATSDLGDNWTSELAVQVDVVMANIHPFFAGVTAEAAAGWTWDFWTRNNVPLTQGTNIKQVISEVGWPSKGGNSCGSSTCTSKTQGSIAGIDEMNTFMENWVCQSMDNKTEYFWFETFDEPWKVRYNEPGKEWEDQWGLMDINRNLKDGVKIPDCGGRTPDY